MINHYKVLGAHAGMDDLQIKELYRVAARKHHPDRGGSAAQFAAVTAAYAALRTPRIRAGLAALYALSVAPCAACSGCGYTQRQRGFTGAERSVCEACSGCGYAAAEASAPKAYKRRD